MKKLMSIFLVLFVAVGMMPIVFAEEGNGDAGNTDSIDAGTTADSEPTDGLMANGRAPKIRPKVQAVQHRVAQVRKNFQDAKQAYEQARERFANVKQKVEQARERIQECDGNEDAECVRARNEVKQNAKPFLEHSADMVLESLEKLAARVEESDMDDDEKADALSDIDEKIAEVEDAKATLENLDGDSTNEEIREAAKTIKNAWQHAKVALKKHAGVVAWSKLRHVYGQLDKLGERLQNAVDKLEEKGHDASDAQDLIDQFNAKLESAKENFENAKEDYQKSDEPGEIDEVARAANGYLRQAHQDLKDARDLLRQIVREIKGVAGNLDAVGSADDSDDDSDDGSEGADDGSDDGSEGADDDSDDGSDDGSEGADDGESDAAGGDDGNATGDSEEDDVEVTA